MTRGVGWWPCEPDSETVCGGGGGNDGWRQAVIRLQRLWLVDKEREGQISFILEQREPFPLFMCLWTN